MTLFRFGRFELSETEFEVFQIVEKEKIRLQSEKIAYKIKNNDTIRIKAEVKQ